MKYIIWFICVFLLHLSGSTIARDVRLFKKCLLILSGTCPDDKNIGIHLFTRQNRDESQSFKIVDSVDNLNETHFNKHHPNKIIVHGFNPHLYTSALVAIKDAYLDKGDYNVWMVDWSKLSNSGICSPFSLQNAGHVGRCLRHLVRSIHGHSDTRKTSATVHVIATGAGTYVANHLAQAVQPITLNRVTGINPASLITQNKYQKLDMSDADFVDLIFTTPFFQHTETLGHVDFYMNPKGVHQPGCNQEKDSFDCDRRRGLQYFAESVSSPVQFVAWPCNGYSQFLLGMCEPESDLQAVGEPCSDTAQGTHISFTADDKPFALGALNETLYKEKGPKGRTDKVSVISNNIKRKFETIKENTPEEVYEWGLFDAVKEHFDEKADNLKSKSALVSLSGAKTIAGTVYKKTLGRIGKPKDTEVTLT